jgi:hypothetical protein
LRKNMAEILFVYRTQTLDRSLDELRRKGGIGSVAAKKADDLIGLIARTEEKRIREHFRLTRNGEYRIRYCRKHDLGSGYRLVFLHKGCHMVLLYVGSHDDCFRWIERNKGLKYEIDDKAYAIRVSCNVLPEDDFPSHDMSDEARLVDEYEVSFMSKIGDDIVLRKIFSGLTKRLTS